MKINIHFKLSLMYFSLFFFFPMPPHLLSDFVVPHPPAVAEILGDNIDFVSSKFLKLSNQIKRNSKNHSDFIIRWYRIVQTKHN